MEEDEKDPEIQTTITQSRPGHNQILHIRQDSANELDHLFNAALNPNNKSKSLPMKLRKLPKSFFQQPDRPRAGHTHSRSMGGLSSTVHSTVGLHIHSRSSSTDSSASHHSNLNLSSSNLHQQSPIHPNNALGQRTGNFTPGPVQQHHPFNNTPGHNIGLQVPQISHSRSKSSPANLQKNPNLQMKVPQQNNTIEIPPDMPLPQGWEYAKTPDGQTYFMNHANRTTTWIDPRIAILKDQQERANAGNMQAANHPQSQMHINSIPNEQSAAHPTLPPGWEQATTPQGELYFINHETRTTSWLDPRSQNMNLQHANQTQMNAQIQRQLQKMNQLDINSQFGQQRNMGGTQIIKQLAREKELFQKMRQQEMLKQSGMDPFLGTGSPYHERDSSRDGGVSGMGGNFNHPRGNEEYMEEMETDSGNHNQQVMNQQQQQQHMENVHQARQQHAQHAQRASNQQQPHFPDFLDSLPASSVDFGNDSNNQQSNNLNDVELVPSISETLTTDFMHDVESMLEPVVKSENMDNMTWL